MVDRHFVPVDRAEPCRLLEVLERSDLQRSDLQRSDLQRSDLQRSDLQRV